MILVLACAAPAHALDDLGVVSGDTFELPGYNDGPSGGGVWPGSSGKRGDVGAMPLPNGVPAGGDIGGGPGSGPTGGDGPGTDGGPKVDQSRPPYLSPKDRVTLKAQNNFNIGSVLPGPCVEPGADSSSSFAKFSIPIQTAGAGPEDPAQALVRLERAMTVNAGQAVAAVSQLGDTIDLYSAAWKSGGHELVEQAGQLLGMGLGMTTVIITESGYAVGEYANLYFGAGATASCAADRDPVKRLIRARALLATSQASRASFQEAKAAVEKLAELTLDSRLSAGIQFFTDQTAYFVAEYGTFALNFIHAHSMEWERYYKREIRKLEQEIRDRRPR